jgi:hypothetical protein
MNKNDIVRAVYNMLMSQSFADWYDTYFNEHVEGVAGFNFKTGDEICSDISELLFNKEL